MKLVFARMFVLVGKDAKDKTSVKADLGLMITALENFSSELVIYTRNECSMHLGSFNAYP